MHLAQRGEQPGGHEDRDTGSGQGSERTQRSGLARSAEGQDHQASHPDARRKHVQDLRREGDGRRARDGLEVAGEGIRHERRCSGRAE